MSRPHQRLASAASYPPCENRAGWGSLVNWATPAAKAGTHFMLTASLKRCPDTNLEFFCLLIRFRRTGASVGFLESTPPFLALSASQSSAALPRGLHQGCNPPRDCNVTWKLPEAVA